MEKMRLETKNITDENIIKILELFPNVATEAEDEKGNLKRAIDFEKLKQELSDDVVDGEEKYDFTWVGKKEAMIEANRPIRKTLRPDRESSVEWENTQNIYIEGDNLEALKLLQESYLSKIKMIYIDPPYNTGNDILYKNDYFASDEEYEEQATTYDKDGRVLFVNTETNARYHSDWLSMMSARLRVAKNFLTDDGCVVVAIDDNELFNLGLLCDEIFGCENRIGVITVVHKPEGRNQAKFFAPSNEYALFYAKNIQNFKLNSVIFDEELLKSFDLEDEKGRYKLISYIAKNHGRDGYDKNLRVNNPKNFYPIYVSPDEKEVTLEKKPGYYEALPITSTQERTWRYIISSFKEKLKENEIVGKIENGKAKIYEKYRVEKGQLIKTHWIDKRYNAMVYGTKLLDELMETKTFDFPKSLHLIIDTLKLTTNKDSIILDFFSGSATTAHACMQLNAEDGGNRKFIMVQIPQTCDEKSEAFKAGYKNICEIGKERIRRAGQQILNQVQNDGKKIDVGFRVFKVDDTNMKEVYYSPSETDQKQLGLYESNIKDDRTDEDLLYGCLLDWGIELSLPHRVENIDGKKVHIVNQDDLVACFEENIPESVIRKIAEMKPTRVVFRDSSFNSDDNKINVEEIFKLITPDTRVKVI